MLRPTAVFRSFLSRRSIQTFRYSIRNGEKPLGNIFFHPRVQFLMKKLTLVSYEKIFEVKKMGIPHNPPKYTFMTDEELQKEQERIKNRAEYLLQVPPLIDEKEDKIEVLSNDTSLDGHDVHHSKIIFTDISFDLKDYERSIVVREPDGLLRTANMDERHRMIQTYFPKPGRQLHTPKMFEHENLQEILERGDYEFILNRACIQFEPYSSHYHQVLTVTYDYVNDKSDFDKLIKTRHFGQFALYLAVNRKIGNLLRYFLDGDKLMSASFLVNLHHIVNSESPQSAEDEKYDDVASFDEACKSVKDFICDSSNNVLDLQPTFDTLVEKLKCQQEETNATLKAHGLQ